MASDKKDFFGAINQVREEKRLANVAEAMREQQLLDDHRKEQCKEVASKSGEKRVGHPDEFKPAVGEIKDNGQHEDYWVLSEEERSQGFVRPVRHSYKHVGLRPTYDTRPLTEEEEERFNDCGYVSFEAYPAHYKGASRRGRFWTNEQLASGCGVVTRMGLAISETYAINPKAYGKTFCMSCRDHISVEEFVWDGADERVGS